MRSRPSRPRARSLSVWLLSALVLALVGTSGLPLTARQAPDLFKGTVFRDIGPTRQGNRFVDFAAVESMPRVFYAAAATGGLFKTENNGFTFTPLFENQPVASLGAVAVSQSNPNMVYLGSGEGNSSRSSYWGDGVYVSTDAGVTWTHSGLTDSQHIARIVVHPTDANTAYVAALGHLYSDNDERGLYKTTDGGKTWTKSLDIKSDGHAIGAADVAMDPKNPLVLYASTYDKERRPWSFSATGPASALYKTIDGGKTWTKLTVGPANTDLGRIGISIFRTDPNVIYTIVEIPRDGNQDAKRRAMGFGESGGSQLYRSDDAGKTWKQVAGPVLPDKNAPPSNAPMPTQPVAGAAGRGAAGAGAAGAAGAGAGGRGADPAAAAAAAQAGRGGRGGGGGLNANDTPYYYSQVRVDPNDKNHVFVLSTSASQTFDGGQTWQGIGAGGDNHALWIDPKDSKHMLLGYDHGLSVTFDGGTSWYHPDNLPGAQLYAVGFDMATPYNVYGGLQDNGSHKGPSTMKGGGAIPFEAWTTVGGGDGQYNVVDWKDSRYLYNESQFGSITRTDMVTGEAANIQYRRPQGPSVPVASDPLRWNWCAPILVSPHNPDVIYHAANVVLRSNNRGQTWEEVSPDLTVNDPSKRSVSTPCDTCGTGNVTYATISTLDESPIVPGLLWAGTDDGNVQVTKDGGRTWTNVRDKIPGQPGFWVSRVEPSHANPAVAYVTMTGLRNDDFRPFIWKTTDYGQTWTSIAGNLPKEAINVVREDPRNANLLFVGTDLGVYVSLDGGTSWSKMRGAPAATGGGGGRGGGGGAGRGGGAPARSLGLLPTNPVHDLKIHPREHELIVATHGRGIFIADVSPYEELTPSVMGADAYLFEIGPAIRWVGGERGAMASSNFPGMSRPNDVGISYYLKNDAAGDVKVRIYDGSRLISEMDGPKSAGVNTVRWNMQERRDRIPGEAAGGGRGGRGGGGGGGGRGGGGGADPNSVTTEAGLGDYRVVLAVGGKEYAQTARIVADPSK
jgi:photosystem II stability/assembly factor-like uncharacterized protein